MRERPTAEDLAAIREVHQWEGRREGISLTSAWCRMASVLAEVDALTAALDAEKAAHQVTKTERDAALRAVAELPDDLPLSEWPIEDQQRVHAAQVHTLTVQIDAEKARAQTADEKNAEMWRALTTANDLRKMRESECAAALTRAKTAEDALARLREVALGALASSPKPGLTVADLLGRVLIEHEEAMVALDAAIAATPADLAEASRREWKAQGMEEAADMLPDEDGGSSVMCQALGCSRVLEDHEGRFCANHEDDFKSDAQRIREAATKLRGER